MKSLIAYACLTLGMATACVSPALQRQTAGGEVMLEPDTQDWRAHFQAVSRQDSAAAVSVEGSALLTPGADGQTTAIVTITHAPPGSILPWHVHVGRCGTDAGVLGPQAAYPPVTVGAEGRGTATAIIASGTPTGGEYHVDVHASPSEMRTLVACGSLRQSAR